MIQAEKPILFSTPMVQAILAGRKTMTRRVMEPQPNLDAGCMWHWKDCQWMDGGLGMPRSGVEDYARYQPGDILWVRETCRISDPHGDFARGDRKALVTYKAGGDQVIALPSDALLSPRWRPSIFMPRAAARIFLRVADVRAEGLQEISEEDAIAEGCTGVPCDHMGRYACEDCMNTGWREPPRVEFMELWEIINAKRKDGRYAWNKNPWVWAYTFVPINREDNS